MKTLGAVIHRHHEMLKWVLDSEAADDYRAWVFPSELDGEKGIKRVQDLSWLIRHNKEIIHPLVGVAFVVRGWRYGKPIGIPPVGPLTVENFRPVMFANFEDGRTFAEQFQDASVLRDWLNRPSFKGYLIDWELNISKHTTTTIGSAEYRAVDVRQKVPII